MIRILNYLYFLSLIVSLFILESCGTCNCPGNPNLVYPRYYSAVDFMKYNTTVECMNSKMTSAWKVRPHTWNAFVNDRDFITYTYDSEYLVFFCLDHHDNYEDMRTQFNRYMSFFKNHGHGFKYSGGNTFSATYLTWKVRVHLSSNSVQVCCTRKG